MALPRRRLVTRRLVRFVARFEGFPDEQPYNDPVGYCTVGYGHLLHYSNCTHADRNKWRGITEREAKRLLREDLRPYAKAVTDNIDRDLSQRQHDALTSFTFNNGIGALQNSTLRRRLNNGEPRCKVIREELPRWVNAGGQPLPGLVRRRAAEVKLACG